MPTVDSFSYDDTTDTVRLFLSGPLDSSVFELMIDSSIVTNAAGDHLDGETGFVPGVSDGVLTGNSGDGIEGGDFAFTLLALPGDAQDLSAGDDSDGSVWNNGPWGVNSTDRNYTVSLQNSFLLDLPVFQGPVGGYDIRSDYNGNNEINSTDANYVTSRQNTFIVFTGPNIVGDDTREELPMAPEAVNFQATDRHFDRLAKLDEETRLERPDRRSFAEREDISRPRFVSPRPEHTFDLKSAQEETEEVVDKAMDELFQDDSLGNTWWS